MVQISISDAFNAEKFYPTDKIILCKYKDKHYALGSFCGFDFTNLATGALIGQKLICPTCGSNYDIASGIVDQGPSMRNISSFNIAIRDEEIKVTLPEHVPAFSRKKNLQRQTLDPRVYVILGDTLTALSAIDALRTNFTGNIVLVPQSEFGAFQNTDILYKKMGKVTKTELFLQEDDFLDRANVVVLKGNLKWIDLDQKYITLYGHKDKINFDKLLIAWGADRIRMKQSFSNVFYLEDLQSHARIHNELLKANQVVVLGGTFEAYQLAATFRDYLDSIGYTDTKIMLLCDGNTDVQHTLGNKVSKYVHDLLREKRISVVVNAKVSRFEGDTKLEKIHFYKAEDKNFENYIEGGCTEYFVKPDFVVAENGIGAPKVELKKVIDVKQFSSVNFVGVDQEGIPASNIRFSLLYNDI